MLTLLLSIILALPVFAQYSGRSVLVSITSTPKAPTDSPGAGTYSSTQSVTLSDATAQFINYTTNGSTPACPATGTLYSGAISVAATTTVKAIGCNGVTGGSVLTSIYTISASGITQVGTCSDGTCQGGKTETGVSSDQQTAVTGTLTVPAGATLLVGTCAGGAPATYTVTDTLGNTWHGVGGSIANIYYAYDHSGSPLATGADVLTCNAGTPTALPVAILTAWSGTLTTSGVFDMVSDAFNSHACPTSAGAGNFQTSQGNELVVCALAGSTDSGPYTISGTQGYAPVGTVPLAGGVNYGGGMATTIQAVAAAVGTGTWSGSSGSPQTVAACFLHP